MTADAGPRTPGISGPAPRPARRFARFRHDAERTSPFYQPLPEDGICLSVFLVLRSSESTDLVLLGDLDPAADWERLAGLSPERVRSWAGGWMLPSSHLLLFEGPGGAADRILVEQLGIDQLTLHGPRVVSETYPRAGGAGTDPHWDVHFIFEGTWPHDRRPRTSCWKHLEFVNVPQTRRSGFRRGHEDILEMVGLRPAP